MIHSSPVAAKQQAQTTKVQASILYLFWGRNNDQPVA
jgi:hypothetical protein